MARRKKHTHHVESIELDARPLLTIGEDHAIWESHDVSIIEDARTIVRLRPPPDIDSDLVESISAKFLDGGHAVAVKAEHTARSTSAAVATQVDEDDVRTIRQIVADLIENQHDDLEALREAVEEALSAGGL